MKYESVAREVAHHLLKIGAIKINLRRPYTWASGWKSPIYCDNRLTLSYPEIRTYIKEELANSIEKAYPNFEAIAGVATAGIPQGALVADILNVPFIYVRSEPKGHGLENLIEGKVVRKQKVVVLEDLISTGGSSLKAASALQAQGFNVLGMMAIFTYGFDIASDNFQNAKLPLTTLSNYADMLHVAVEQKIVKEKDLLELKSWRVDPVSWKK